MHDFVIRTLSNAGGTAAISDYGAHLLRWAPAGQPDVIWTPSTWRFEDGRPLGGGVPICFPWFGPGYAHGRQTAKSPIHGFARRSWWRLDSDSSAGGQSVGDQSAGSCIRYVLEPADAPAGEVPWLDDEPNPRFRAVYDVTLLARSLTMALTVVNTGDAPLTFEAALHSYLHIGDLDGARLRGLGGSTYLDATIAGFPPKTQADEDVTFGDSAVDRVYYSDRPLELHDDVLGRTIRIAKSGSPQTVVWNPGRTGGETLANTRPGAGEWRGFVAVEAAICRGRAVTLAPGASHTLAQTLTVA